MAQVEDRHARCRQAAMIRNAAIAALLTLASSILSAQVHNAAYAEIGGNGGALTVNYERRLTTNLYGRIGLSTVSSSNDSGDSFAVIVPLMVNYLTNPSSAHHLEAGAGVTIVSGDQQDLWGEGENQSVSNVVGTATVGYRYQKPGRGFVFRAGFTPIFDQHDFLPWAGVSFGYAW